MKFAKENLYASLVNMKKVANNGIFRQVISTRRNNLHINLLRRLHDVIYHFFTYSVLVANFSILNYCLNKQLF